MCMTIIRVDIFRLLGVQLSFKLIGFSCMSSEIGFSSEMLSPHYKKIKIIKVEKKRRIYIKCKLVRELV